MLRMQDLMEGKKFSRFTQEFPDQKVRLRRRQLHYQARELPAQNRQYSSYPQAARPGTSNG